MNIFDVILINPLINLLVIFYQVLAIINIPYALGFAIIGLTILIRLLLYPLTSSQLRTSKKMQEIAPHVSRIREKHKGDAMRIQQETMQLYREQGVNPAAGCIPVLIQLPLLWALYSVLQRVVSLGKGTEVAQLNAVLYSDIWMLTEPWNTTFFGLPLGQSPAALLGTLGPLVFLVPLFTAVFQFIQSKMMFPVPPPPTPEGKKKKDAAPKQGDFAAALQTQTLYIFPLMIGFFSYTFPLGLSLYWNTFTIFGILQQYRVSGLGGLEPSIARILKRS